MRFGAISLDMKLGDHEAGTLQGSAGISIGPESSDVGTLEHPPTSVARIAHSDAPGHHSHLGNSLEGTLRAAPEEIGRVLGMARDLYHIDVTRVCFNIIKH